MRCSWVYRLLFRKGGTRMKKYSATSRYLVSQITVGNLTYKEVVTKRTDLQPEIDEYIDFMQLDIDKTV